MNTIKCHIEAIAIKQRKLSVNRDKGLHLPANYNPLLEIRNN